MTQTNPIRPTNVHNSAAVGKYGVQRLRPNPNKGY